MFGICLAPSRRVRRRPSSVRPRSSLGYRLPAPETRLTNNKGMEKWKSLRVSHFSTPPTETI